ncbi:hypothetical protein [Micromonospora sp. NPDC005299]|uniref:hypothetical protein n=1 Tax=Micromonospora sp. NPDC005299 TaxID=3364231 RepID=UPI0036922A7A
MPEPLPDQPPAPELHVRADLGPVPLLDDVVRYLNDVSTVWLFAAHLSVLADASGVGDTARSLLHDVEEEEMDEGGGGATLLRPVAGVDSIDAAESDTIFVEVKTDGSIDPESRLTLYRSYVASVAPEPRVRQLKIASPLEAVLTTLAGDVKPVGYSVGALVVAERILQMIMDWQKHRADLAERKEARGTTERAVPAQRHLAALDSSPSASGMAGPGIAQQVAWEVVPDAAILDEVGASEAINRLAHSDLLEVRLYLPRSWQADRPTT